MSERKRYLPEIKTHLYFLILFAIVAGFFVYQHSNDKAGETSFVYNHYPKIVYDGKIIDKYRVDDTTFFVMLVDGEHRKVANINIDTYYKFEKDDTVSLIVQNEHRKISGKAVFVILVILVFVWFADAAIPFTVSFLMYATAQWLGFKQIDLVFVLINTLISQSWLLWSDFQKYRIRTALLSADDKKFFVIMSAFDDKSTGDTRVKWLGFVYVTGCVIYFNKADAVAGKLRGC